MEEENKTKEQLLEELEALRKEITELKKKHTGVEEKLRKQHSYLAALHETTLALMNRLELNDLLEAIITRAGVLLGTPHGYIHLVEPGESETVMKIGTGIYSHHIGFRHKPGEGLIGKVWLTGQPLAVEDYHTWSGRLPNSPIDDFRAVVGVPLKSGSKVLGVLGLAYLERGRAFKDEEIELLNRFAQLASLALDNALLYTSAQQELAERKRAEEALAAEKEQLVVTLCSIGDGVITTDIEGKVVLLNPVAEKLTGWTQQEAAGKPLQEVLHVVQDKTQGLYENPIEKAIKTGIPTDLAHPAILIARDGTRRIISNSGAPIRNKQGQIMGMVLVFRDITEKQKIEEERLKASKLESIGVLAGGLAHDFNNILTAILMNISLAKKCAYPQEEVFRRLTEAEKASLRAKDLTQQLLTFSKGGLPVKKTISIAQLIRDSVNFVLRGSSVRCEFFLSEDLWPVEVDEGQITQVIHNLVINAQQAMPQGGVIQIYGENVMISAEEAGLGLPLPAGNYIKISLKDSGVGIPEEHLTKIFDPYFTTKEKGSGLGLTTVYSIIQKHKGYITAQSKLGAGTTFHLYLPASQKSIPTENRVEENPPSGKGKILIMDDENIVTEAVSQMLSYMGYQVEVAKDGSEAIQLYQKAKELGQPFQVTIMDLTVPGGMGGKEAIARLREIDPHVKAIVSSGYSNDPVMANFQQYGFSGVIAKPYRWEELSKLLQNLAIYQDKPPTITP
jgi:PAS domain S-box-containing protein